MSLLIVTNKCNQKCLFCSAYNRNNNIIFRNILNQIKTDNDKLIRISGGEPFLLKTNDLIKILSLLYKYKKQIEFQTNATIIKDLDKDKLKKVVNIINATNGYFNINFSAATPQINYKLTKLKNGFKDKITGIKILKSMKAKIRITYIINRINYKHLLVFSNYVVKNMSYIDWVQFSFVKAMGRAEKNNKVVPRYKEVSPYLIKALNILFKNKIKFDIDHIPLCYLGKFWQYHVDIYKIKNKIKGIYLEEKKKVKKCKKCKFYAICSGPRTDYLDIYGDID